MWGETQRWKKKNRRRYIETPEVRRLHSSEHRRKLKNPMKISAREEGKWLQPIIVLSSWNPGSGAVNFEIVVICHLVWNFFKYACLFRAGFFLPQMARAAEIFGGWTGLKGCRVVCIPCNYQLWRTMGRVEGLGRDREPSGVIYRLWQDEKMSEGNPVSQWWTF